MTQTEFNKIDFNKLTDEGRMLFEQSDQCIWEFFEEVDNNDYEKINEVAVRILHSV